MTKYGLTKGLPETASLRIPALTVLLAAGVFTAVLSFGVRADDGPDHQLEQSVPMWLGTTGGNINDFGTRSGTDGYCCSGTLGALVTDGNNSYYVLSNSHVLKSNPGAEFFSIEEFQTTYDYILDDYIIHPGLIDQDNSDGNKACKQDTGDAVAIFTVAVPIDFYEGVLPVPINIVDGAIAEVVTSNVNLLGAILDIDRPNTTTLPADAVLDLSVQKSGRTTGHTTGKVAAIDVTVDVGYSVECGSSETVIARFTNQIRISGKGRSVFSAGGDSGSLILSNDNRRMPVGLLFAGGRRDTFANPIDDVLSELGYELGVVMTIVGDDDLPVFIDSGGSGGGGGNNGKKPKKNRGGAPSSLSPVGLDVARDVKARHDDELFELPDVVGTGVSVDNTGNPVIEIYLGGQARRGIGGPIPDELEGVRVRVIETGPIRAF